VIPRLTFQDGAVESVELHPITLGHGLTRGTRGCPALASVEDGERILDRVARLSEPFGAGLEIERGDDRVTGRLAID